MKKTAIIFPGQGTQKFEMGKDFYEKKEFAKEIFDYSFSKNPSLENFLFKEENSLLSQTNYAQLGIITTEIAICHEVLKTIKVDGCAGFSLGEYSALWLSGFIGEKELLNLVDFRGNLMQNHQIEGTMYALLRTNIDDVKNLLCFCQENGLNLELANYNTKDQIVLSGLSEEFEKAKEFFEDFGIKKALELNVSGPFHSSFFQEVSEIYEKNLNEQNYFSKLVPTNDLYLNLTGKKYKQENLNKYLAEHLVKGVNWYPLIQEMINDGYDTFIEVGPGKVLSGFLKKIDKNVKIINVETVEDLEKLKEI